MYIFFTFHLQLNYVYSLLGVMSMAFLLIKEGSYILQFTIEAIRKYGRLLVSLILDVKAMKRVFYKRVFVSNFTNTFTIIGSLQCQ